MKIIHKIITSAVLLALSGTVFGQNAPNGSTQPSATPDTTLPAYMSGIKINYVRSWQPSKAITDPNTVVTSGLVKDVKESTQYLDGLGRPLQSVTKAISPNGKDIVAPVTYDAYGQERFKFLPYEAGTGNGQFKMAPFTEPATFYSTQYPGESIFYSKTDFEGSPLHRPLKQMAPGNSWAGSGNGVSQQYLVNTADDNVRIWDITSDPAAVPVARSTPYQAGLLFKNVTIDEAQHKVEEYKNKEGQVILKKCRLTKPWELDMMVGCLPIMCMMISATCVLYCLLKWSTLCEPTIGYFLITWRYRHSAFNMCTMPATAWC
ncbi:DUF6443 domain-containing protein [Chitinophaga sedimenti]|uniref:DUF6443 domain-containing protein n=1 Tax=Chitinophaga sedimenti TaxID=2033606 RepID=UPI0020056A40|nr:DUF6443 domain-containing protein [Chitinophaga sedimenti]MCK7560243.1 DUF6443 domain-containing protein [Chitinophaga sedimenti]